MGKIWTMVKSNFKKFSNVKCNHSFKMDEVWDTDKDPKCTKCGKLLSELTPKIEKKK
jgi:NAD-dependent SIR2 family protein deacetylase